MDKPGVKTEVSLHKKAKQRQALKKKDLISKGGDKKRNPSGILW